MKTNYIKNAFAFIVTVLFILNKNSFCFAKEITLGGKNGWDTFEFEQNLTRGKGRFGYDCVELASNSFVFDEFTDLLIDFENDTTPVSSGKYSVRENNMERTNNTKLEKYAGLSRNLGGLSVFGERGTFFGSEGLMGSFSIEFWLCPSITENGEVLIKWNTNKNVGGKLLYQIINAVFNKGHLEWELSNIFETFNLKTNLSSSDIVLKGTSSIIPDEWSYHVLSFDCESGRLEYIVNGITEDLVYITDNGREGGEVSLVMLGTPSELQICPIYTGKIDDFRILRRPYSPPDFQSAENAGKLGHTQYVPYGGKFITKPIRVSDGAMLNALNAIMNVPSQTEICFYVRSGDNYYGWTQDEPKWKSVESGQKITGVNGLYFQVSAELLPDGNGEVSPSITAINLDFSELPEPLPPFVVKAEAGNGCVTVSWNYSVDGTAGGYYLYYGNRPGEYLGRIAFEGPSPINVGNTSSYTLTGLENGRIYYFAVAAWSSFDEHVVGELSKEVFARPLSKLAK